MRDTKVCNNMLVHNMTNSTGCMVRSRYKYNISRKYINSSYNKAVAMAGMKGPMMSMDNVCHGEEAEIDPGGTDAWV